MLRGDDDLLSLMEEMGGGGDDVPRSGSKDDRETEKKKSKKSKKQKRPRSRDDDDDDDPTATAATGVRLLPEAEGYGCARTVTGGGGSSRRAAAAEMIWNPYVHVRNSYNQGIVIHVPTNPHVEVLRRRSYEKFKRGYYAIFQSTAESARAAEGDAKLHAMRRSDAAAAGSGTNAASGNQRKADRTILNQTWGDLPPHSILERWHFAAKVEEDMLARQCRTTTSTKAASAGNKRTATIRDAIVTNRRNGTSVDPILINLSQQSQQRQGLLLKEEVIFQWKRERRRKVGVAAGNSSSASRDLEELDDELERILGSQKFNRRVAGIVGAIKDLARGVEADFIKELGRRASQEASSHATFSSGGGGKKKKKRDKSIPKITFGDVGSHDPSKPREVTFYYSGLSLKINETHYIKLQMLFDRFNADSASLSEHRGRFASDIFALLCRYDMLEGGGLQSSLTGDVFDVLLEHFDCRTECFASPFNCRYERFCSAFPDTDMAFGSLGSFFDFDPTPEGGCFQANPPFISGFIEMMQERMDFLLKSTSKKPLMFIVFIPAWKETSGWKALNESQYLTRHLLLSQKSDPHFYCEGTQHRRRGRYRVATFDTSVFFLQNSTARDRWPVTDEILGDLTFAFGRNPNEDGDKEDSTKGSVHESKREGKRRKVTKKEEDGKGREGDVPLEDTTSRKSRAHSPKSGKEKAGKEKRKKRKLVKDGESKQMEILSSIFGGKES